MLERHWLLMMMCIPHSKTSVESLLSQIASEFPWFPLGWLWIGKHLLVAGWSSGAGQKGHFPGKDWVASDLPWRVAVFVEGTNYLLESEFSSSCLQPSSLAWRGVVDGPLWNCSHCNHRHLKRNRGQTEGTCCPRPYKPQCRPGYLPFGDNWLAFATTGRQVLLSRRPSPSRAVHSICSDLNGPPSVGWTLQTCFALSYRTPQVWEPLQVQKGLVNNRWLKWRSFGVSPILWAPTFSGWLPERLLDLRELVLGHASGVMLHLTFACGSNFPRYFGGCVSLSIDSLASWCRLKFGNGIGFEGLGMHWLKVPILQNLRSLREWAKWIFCPHFLGRIGCGGSPWREWFLVGWSHIIWHLNLDLLLHRIHGRWCLTRGLQTRLKVSYERNKIGIAFVHWRHQLGKYGLHLRNKLIGKAFIGCVRSGTLITWGDLSQIWNGRTNGTLDPWHEGLGCAFPRFFSTGLRSRIHALRICQAVHGHLSLTLGAQSLPTGFLLHLICVLELIHHDGCKLLRSERRFSLQVGWHLFTCLRSRLPCPLILMICNKYWVVERDFLSQGRMNFQTARKKNDFGLVYTHAPFDESDIERADNGTDTPVVLTRCDLFYYLVCTCTTDTYTYVHTTREGGGEGGGGRGGQGGKGSCRSSFSPCLP